MAKGSRKGKTEPRLWTPPLRKLTPDTTLGYDMIDFSCNVLGIDPLPWECWLFIHAFEIIGSFDKAWRLRFRIALVLVARQNGKTYVTKIIALFFLYMLGVALVLGTAQDLSKAAETWEETVNEAMKHSDLAGEITKKLEGKGSQELRLTGYRRYLVATPNEKNMRGRSADLVFLDETRTHKTFDAWNAASKTIKARPSAIIWCMSNAGTSESVVLRHLRSQAHKTIGDPDGYAAAYEGADQRELTEEEREALSSVAIFEWSARPGCDKWDRDQWAQANPSMGYGFLEESVIATDCATDKENDFRTEDLCQWVTVASNPPFPDGAWEAGMDEESRIMETSPLCFGVDVSTNRKDIYVAVCGVRPDGSWHVEVVAHGTSSTWLVEWFRSRVHTYGGSMRVAVQGSGAPVSAYVDLLKAVEGLEITECKGTRDLSSWCGRLYDSVAALGTKDEQGGAQDDNSHDVVPVFHRPTPVLDVAAETASTRKVGDGVFVWDREESREDIAPLVAVTMAFGLATTPVEVEVKKSAYADHDFIML